MILAILCAVLAIFSGTASLVSLYLHLWWWALGFGVCGVALFLVFRSIWQLYDWHP